MRSRRLSASSNPTSFGCVVVDTAGVEILLMLVRAGRVRHILANFTERPPLLWQWQWVDLLGAVDRIDGLWSGRQLGLGVGRIAAIIASGLGRQLALERLASGSGGLLNGVTDRLAVSAARSRAEAARPCGACGQAFAPCGILSGISGACATRCAGLQFAYRPLAARASRRWRRAASRSWRLVGTGMPRPAPRAMPNSPRRRGWSWT